MSEPVNQTNVLDLIDSVKAQLEGMEKFVRRRFDELSMEVNATSQQLDMAEEGLGRQVAEIITGLSSISHDAGGSTATNTGWELESVIAETEKAANIILDAADRIAIRMEAEESWKDENIRSQYLAETKADVQQILMACTFQDLTGQRVRKTLDNLHNIESKLSSTMQKLGFDVEADKAQIEDESRKDKAQSQSDIDALFS